MTVCRIFSVAITGMGTAKSTCLLHDFKGRLHFPRNILRVTLVKNVANWQHHVKSLLAFIAGIYLIVDSNKPDTHLQKYPLNIITGVKIVSAQPTEIFYKNTGNLLRLCISKHAPKSRAVIIGSRITVVHIFIIKFQFWFSVQIIKKKPSLRINTVRLFLISVLF